MPCESVKSMLRIRQRDAAGQVVRSVGKPDDREDIGHDSCQTAMDCDLFCRLRCAPILRGRMPVAASHAHRFFILLLTL